MTDIAKEIQKLKALVNQRQTTAIFSNKSNESTKLALGDTELYINDMTRKFSFTRAGVINPVMIDAKTKSIENLIYINGTKVEDMTSAVGDIEELERITADHAERITNVESRVDNIYSLVVEEPIGPPSEITWEYTNENGELHIKFSPNLTLDDLQFKGAYYYVMSIEWNPSYIWDDVYFRKYMNEDGTYTVMFGILDYQSWEVVPIEWEWRDSTFIYKHYSDDRQSIRTMGDAELMDIFNEVIEYEIKLRDSKFKTAIVNTIHDEIPIEDYVTKSEFESKEIEQDDRITQVENDVEELQQYIGQEHTHHELVNGDARFTLNRTECTTNRPIHVQVNDAALKPYDDYIDHTTIELDKSAGYVIAHTTIPRADVKELQPNQRSVVCRLKNTCRRHITFDT